MLFDVVRISKYHNILTLPPSQLELATSEVERLKAAPPTVPSAFVPKKNAFAAPASLGARTDSPNPFNKVKNPKTPIGNPFHNNTSSTNPFDAKTGTLRYSLEVAKASNAKEEEEKKVKEKESDSGKKASDFFGNE